MGQAGMTAQAEARTTTDIDGRIPKRSLMSYAAGSFGRVAVHTLIITFLMTYLTLGVGLSDWQLGLIGVIIVLSRICDALSAPLLGRLIDNTQSRWGKFKPYVATGCVLNAAMTVMLFTTHIENEKLYLLVFTITCLLWGFSYTMTEVSASSMLPALTLDPKERERLAGFSRTGGVVGMVGISFVVPAITAGRMATMYRGVAMVTAALLLLSQFMLLAGMRERRNAVTSVRSHVSLKGMVQVIVRNDQLLAAIGAIALYFVGFYIFTGFGVQFFYFDYGNYGGMEFSYFSIMVGVTQVLVLGFYRFFARRFTRRQLFGLAILLVTAGTVCFMLTRYVVPMNLPIVLFAGFLQFAAQALIQMLSFVLVADTVEYGQWKLGTRNESVIFSLNTMVIKLSSAIQVGVLSATMVLSGLNQYAQRISVLEKNAALGKAEVLQQANLIVAEIPERTILIFRFAMMVLPIILFAAAYILFMKKFKIDDAMYKKIVSDLHERAQTEKDTADD